MPATLESENTMQQRNPKPKKQYTEASLKEALQRAQEVIDKVQTSDEIVDIVIRPLEPGGVGGHVWRKEVIGYRR